MEKRYRYPGVQPFAEEDNPIFYGREKDIENLRRKLYVQKLVVLQSKSGYGKSSLINAGIKPLFSSELDTYKYEFISIQFDNLEKSPLQIFYSYLECLIEEKRAELKREYNASQDPFQNQIKKRLLYEEYLGQVHSISLWHYFKRLQLLDRVLYKDKVKAYAYSQGEDIIVEQEKPTKYFIILDQFEKLLFYHTEQKYQVEEFGRELADLFYHKIPSSFLAALHLEKYRDNDIYANKEFYDFFQSNPEWEEFLREPTPLYLLLGIRTDKLILIDRLSKFIPDLALNKYELSPLSKEGAQKAISQPARLKQEEIFKSESFIYHPEAEKKIIRFLTQSTIEKNHIQQTHSVEVYQLQMICQHIEEKIIEGRILPNQIDGLIEVMPDDIDDLEDIVRNYYKNELNKFPKNEKKIVQCFIEENLILENEKRRVFIDEGVAQRKLIEYGISPDELDSFIEKLTDIRIIRRELSSFNSIYHYELSHDTLIHPALEFKKERLLLEEEEKRKEAERKKQEELELTQKLEEEKRQSELLLAQQVAREERKKRKQTLIISSIIGCVLATLIFAIFLYYNEANKAQQQVIQLNKIAEQEHEIGLTALQEALVAKQEKDSMSKLTNYLSVENRDYQKIKVIYDSLENIRLGYEKTILTKESKIRELSQIIESKDDIINNNYTKISELTKQNNDYKKDQDKINSINKILDKKDSLYRKLQVDYQESQTKLMQLGSDINSLKKRNEELAEEIKKLKR